jgi:Transcription factor WhiB
MAVSLDPASVDSGPTANLLDWAAAWPPHRSVADRLADQALSERVIRYARCADSDLDPDDWFPVSTEIDKARQEAAAAITICTACVVRAECLALSLRRWDVGQHGVWGGLVAAERTAMRRDPSLRSVLVDALAIRGGRALP